LVSLGVAFAASLRELHLCPQPGDADSPDEDPNHRDDRARASPELTRAGL
jgi:hypothetical protein